MPAMKKWFTIEELASHNSPFDCYVSIYGTVYDLTHLIPQHPRALSWPLLEMAGKDISHWFEPRTADMTTGVELLMEFDPQMQISTYCIPPKVPMEETINQIMERYVSLNAHALSYEALSLCTCAIHKGKVFMALDMNKSLEENRVFDESREYGDMGMQINHLIPVMDVHYTDDLTVA